MGGYIIKWEKQHGKNCSYIGYCYLLGKNGKTNRKTFYVHGLEEQIFKRSILSKAIHRFNAIPT